MLGQDPGPPIPQPCPGAAVREQPPVRDALQRARGPVLGSGTNTQLYHFGVDLSKVTGVALQQPSNLLSVASGWTQTVVVVFFLPLKKLFFYHGFTYSCLQLIISKRGSP